MKKLVCSLSLLLVFAMQFAVADIVISEPSDVYNLGDKLYVTVDGIRGSGSGNLNIDLLCEGNTTNLVKISARAFSLDEEQSYSIPYKILNREDLEVENLSSLVGDCQVVASLGQKSSSTKSFIVSDKIDVETFLDGHSYDPGEQIVIQVNAVKENGHNLNGFLEVTNATTFSKAVEDGVAKEIFSLSETTEAGIYFLNIYVYDVGPEGFLNVGSDTVSFIINQVAKSVVMSMSAAEAIPGGEFSVGMEIFDQSGIKMDGEIDAKLVSPDDEVMEFTLESGELQKFLFEDNDTAGTWKIYSTFNNLAQEREFNLRAVQKAEFEIVDSILIVKNVGNDVYNKTINVTIGDDIKTLDLNIGIGEIRKFNLGAPKGEYDVLVDDGDTSINKHLLLTGNAVSVDDMKSPNALRDHVIFWIFLVLIVGGVSFILIRRHRKHGNKDKTSSDKIVSSVKDVNEKGKNFMENFRKMFSKLLPKKIKSRVDDSLNYTNKSPSVQGLDSSKYHHEDKTMIDLTRRKMNEAESTLVMKGNKHPSSVVAISIKNFGEMSDSAKEYLHKTISNEQGKGLVDWRSDYVFVIFSPIVTKTYGNEILATKCAMGIKDDIDRHNKRYRDKIEINLGINSGDIVATKESGKLKYTSIGNTISFSKRISDSDTNKVLVSDSIRKKLLRDLKVERSKEIGENPTFEVLEIKDRKDDERRLKELMKRMDN